MLSAPLRVYWDLAAGPEAPSRELALKVARELASLKVFFVILRLDGRRDDLADIMAVLKEGGVRVTVSISEAGSFPGPDALALTDDVDFRPADAAGLGQLIAETGGVLCGGGMPSVSVAPSRDNINEALRIISCALGAGLRNFNLINPCLVYDRGCAREFVIGADERDILCRGLEGLLGPLGSDVKLLVHDLFLHKELKLPGLAGRIEYAGCQAGDAIAYIDRACAVYPCATMPVLLGSLHETTLKDIWATGNRKQLRERIVELPDGCAGCSDAPVCKGGCRGLAWEAGGADSVDPGCGKYTGLV